MKTVRVGAGSAGWPDMIDPALVSAERGELDYQGFDHLAELTMAILEKMKVRNPQRGYIPDVIPLMKRLLPIWKAKGRHCKMVTNGGGANPEQCAIEVMKVAKGLGLEGMKIGVITGDDLPVTYLDTLKAQGIKFKNAETGEEDIDRVRDKIMAAYVYIGADRVVEALNAGADLVIGGRLSDNSLFVGPFMHAFGWKFEDEYWDRIGAGVATAHLLECAGWSTGICSTQWEKVPVPWNLGFPIAEMSENGEAIICKPPGTGGLVSEYTMKEHLVYEVHDPQNYLMPDGIADLTQIKVTQVGDNRVKISKAGDKSRGKPRPKTLKLCLAYDDGYIMTYTMVVSAPKALEQAKRVEDYLQHRFKIRGLKPKDMLISYLGINSLHGPAAPMPKDPPNEVAIRFAVKADTEEEANVYKNECTLTWYAAGVGAAFTAPDIRQVMALWPTLVPREAIPMKLEMKEVK